MTQTVAFYIAVMFFEIEILQRRQTAIFTLFPFSHLDYILSVLLDKATRVTGRDNFTGMASYESFLTC